MVRQKLPIDSDIIPKICLKYIFKISHWSQMLCGLPYVWKSGKFVITKGSLRNWRCLATLQLANTCFVIIRILWFIYGTPDFSISSHNFKLFQKSIIFFSWNLFCTAIGYIQTSRMQTVVTWSNSYMQYVTWFASMEYSKKKKEISHIQNL